MTILTRYYYDIIDENLMSNNHTVWFFLSFRLKTTNDLCNKFIKTHFFLIDTPSIYLLFVVCKTAVSIIYFNPIFSICMRGQGYMNWKIFVDLILDLILVLFVFLVAIKDNFIAKHYKYSNIKCKTLFDLIQSSDISYKRFMTSLPNFIIEKNLMFVCVKY